MNSAKLFHTLCRYSCVLAAALFCSQAFAAPKAPEYIKIGTLYASSGHYAHISMPMYQGLKLWVHTVNADGGVFVKPFGKKIPVKLVAYNDQSSTATATTLYNRLITEDHVDILTSDSATQLTAVAVPVAQHHKMLLFNQTGTGAVLFSKDNKYIVQLDDSKSSLWPKNLVEFMNKFAVDHGIHRVALLYVTSDATLSMVEAVRSDLSDKLKVVYSHGVPIKTSSYNVLLHAIAATHPDAVLSFGYVGNTIAFLRDLRSSGLKFPMVFTMLSGVATGAIEKNVGPEGMQGTYTFVFPSGLGYVPNAGFNRSQFEAAYHKMYGDDASVDFNSVAGYTTGVIIGKTLATTQSMDQLALRKAVFGLSGNLQTLVGPFELKPNGVQTGALMGLGQFQSDGKGGIKLVPVYPLKQATGKPVWGSAQH